MKYEVVALSVAFAIAAGAFAQTPTSKTIEIEHAWARATPSLAKSGVVYMTLVNDGTADDRLLAVTTPLADKVQIHSETEEAGIMKMRELETIALPPRFTVVLKPGGIHMMMLGLKQQLKEGEAFPLELVFEKAGIIEVTIPIKKVGAVTDHD